ncbi:MAG: calcium/proton exchanger [bacterium]
MQSISRGERITLGLGVALTALAGALHYLHAGDVLTFIASAAALSLLATAVGHGTEQLGSRMGPGATGMLQSALGNLPELFICIFSLRAGLVDVVKSALIGSMLANSLLVLGLAVIVGGIRNGTQRFSAESPRMIVTLMMIAVAALMVPTIADGLHTPAGSHEAALSAACALVLIVVFLASVPFSLSADPAIRPDPEPEPVDHAAWPMAVAIGVLSVAGVGAAFVSEWFVDAMLPATRSLGISEAFTGFVIVAIAGNAVENVVGIQLAAKNRMDYALSVILNSSLQIALLVTPILVFASFFIGPTPLTLVLAPLLVAALALATVVTAFITFDGKSIWMEGVALVGLYCIIAAAFWWG